MQEYLVVQHDEHEKRKCKTNEEEGGNKKKTTTTCLLPHFIPSNTFNSLKLPTFNAKPARSCIASRTAEQRARY